MTSTTPYAYTLPANSFATATGGYDDLFLSFFQINARAINDTFDLSVTPTNNPGFMTTLTISVSTANIQVYVTAVSVTVIWTSYNDNMVDGQNNMYNAGMYQPNVAGPVENNAYLAAWIDDQTDFSIIYGVNNLQHSANLMDIQLSY